MANYFDYELIEKYKMSGPRYTSYPTAVEFNSNFQEPDAINTLIDSNNESRDLSLYFHIPFCEHVCYYCACNKIITKNHAQSDEYLKFLHQEFQLSTKYLDKKRKVVQIHFGGGTPTFISKDDYSRLWELLENNLSIDVDGEFSIEIDPRTVNREYLSHLFKLGFNRLSFGIQDFSPDVQKEINRIQSYEMIENLFNIAREIGFKSISVDLIYGLPLQNKQKFSQTIEKIINLSPDRLAVFNYAHLPDIFGTQKQINSELLPSAKEKLKILDSTIEQLVNNGYEFIGLDHFAKPSDNLVQHQKQGTLYRNFQGYSSYSNCDLIGCGISAISQFNGSYYQNHKARDKYYAFLSDGKFPIVRGIKLNDDDKIRRKIITEIMCNLRVDLSKISSEFNIDAKKYLAKEWQELNALCSDGLIEKDADKLIVLPLGRLLIRNIAMVFDKYLQAKKHRFSQVI